MPHRLPVRLLAAPDPTLLRTKMSQESGTITKWNDDKGFGFITPQSNTKKIFLHINAFSKEHQRPVQGLRVTYDIGTDSQGRSCAIRVAPSLGHKKVSKTDRQIFFARVFSCIFLALVGLLVIMKVLPVIILSAYIILSIATFLAYKKDKSAAESDEWRIPENKLHLLSLIGGWPGALIAQNTLRHKSKKISFRTVYWLTVVINCGALAWLATPEGALTLQRLMHTFY